MLAVAVLATLALPAHALADESLAATGSITYTWQGDPARGCAAVGVCDVHGELIVGSLGLSTSLAFGGGAIDIPLFGSSATVRVTGPGGDCVDIPGGVFGGDLLLERTHGRLAGQIEPALSIGRCAGPLQQDFARLTLPVKRSGGKHPSFDLRASQSFAAGPFSGLMVSSLRLRPAPSGGGSSTSSSGVSGPATPTHHILLEQVTLHYRVASLPGAVDAGFSGEPDPFCAALGSCGTSGSVALSVGDFRHTIAVTATRVVPKRLGARQILADLRRGRLTMDGGEFPPSSPSTVPTAASETFRAADGTQCQASSSAHQAQLFFGPGPESRPTSALEVSLGDADNPSLLRTTAQGRPTPTRSDRTRHWSAARWLPPSCFTVAPSYRCRGPETSAGSATLARAAARSGSR